MRYTQEAREDLERLFDSLLIREVAAAEKALATIEKSMVVLEEFPFSCRKADPHHPFLRELIVRFGHSGYVALFEIEPGNMVSILAIRHQREDDYH